MYTCVIGGVDVHMCVGGVDVGVRELECGCLWVRM